MNIKLNERNTVTRKVAMNLHVKCANRKPFVDQIIDQDGWHANGTPRLITRPNNMSKSCKLDTRHEQPGCINCRWRDQLDPRDLEVTTASAGAPPSAAITQ